MVGQRTGCILRRQCSLRYRWRRHRGRHWTPSRISDKGLLRAGYSVHDEGYTPRERRHSEFCSIRACQGRRSSLNPSTCSLRRLPFIRARLQILPCSIAKDVAQANVCDLELVCLDTSHLYICLPFTVLHPTSPSPSPAKLGRRASSSRHVHYTLRFKTDG